MTDPKPALEARGDLLPSVDVEGTRRRLLESALELFADFGYHGVAVKEITQKAGIQAGSMYVHFSSKEQLLVELMLVGHEEHRDRLREAATRAGEDPVDRLREIVRAHVRVHAAYPLLATVAHQDWHALSPDGLERVLAILAESEQTLIGAIDAGRHAGVFRYPDTFLAAAAIGAMGIRVAAWYRPGAEYASRYSVEDIADAYADFAIKLLS